MPQRKIISEQWYKVVKYEDGTEITTPYPDHRKEPKMDADMPPSTYNGGLSHNEQYKETDPSAVFATMYDKLYED